MSRIHSFSSQVIDYAERLSEMADAAEGRRRGNRGRDLVVLPAVGAAIYALAKSDFASRQAKSVVGEARSVAAELQDDLMGRVRQVSATPAAGGNGSTRRRSSASRKQTTPRSTRTTKSRPRRTASSSR
jgi:hypothetical protein